MYFIITMSQAKQTIQKEELVSCSPKFVNWSHLQRSDILISPIKSLYQNNLPLLIHDKREEVNLKLCWLLIIKHKG